MASARQELTALDWIAAILAALLGAGVVCFPLVGRRFEAMYRDMGNAHIPALTRLAVSTWLPCTLGAIVLACVAFGLSSRGGLGTRRASIVGGFVLGGAALAVLLIGVYLPVFRLAGAVSE